jgi:hypothetical protein
MVNRRLFDGGRLAKVAAGDVQEGASPRYTLMSLSNDASML